VTEKCLLLLKAMARRTIDPGSREKAGPKYRGRRTKKTKAVGPGLQSYWAGMTDPIPGKGNKKRARIWEKNGDRG